jgi:hypothetical protein
VDEKVLVVTFPLANQGLSTARVLGGDLSDIFGPDLAHGAASGAEMPKG